MGRPLDEDAHGGLREHRTVGGARVPVALTAPSTAARASIRPPPCSVTFWPSTVTPKLISASLSRAAVHSGCRCANSAAAPATWGVAMKVPEAAT